MLKRKLVGRGGPPPSRGVNIPQTMIDILGWGELTHIGVSVDVNAEKIIITKFKEDNQRIMDNHEQ